MNAERINGGPHEMQAQVEQSAGLALARSAILQKDLKLKKPADIFSDARGLPPKEGTEFLLKHFHHAATIAQEYGGEAELERLSVLGTHITERMFRNMDVVVSYKEDESVDILTGVWSKWLTTVDKGNNPKATAEAIEIIGTYLPRGEDDFAKDDNDVFPLIGNQLGIIKRRTLQTPTPEPEPPVQQKVTIRERMATARKRMTTIFSRPHERQPKLDPAPPELQPAS